MTGTATMTSTATASAAASLLDDFPLDILGQQPLFNIYTQICNCYPMPDDSDAARAHVIDTLTTGLERLTAAFPWVAGAIVTDADADADAAQRRIRPHTRIPRLVQNDLRHDPHAPTWSALEAAAFPMRMLDEAVVAPIATFPVPTGDPAVDAAPPVLALQATFLRGGLVLCFAAHHATMDMVAQSRLMSLLSRACEGGAITPDDMAAGNLHRADAVPLLTDDEYAALDPALLAPQMLPAPDEKAADAGSPPGKCVWTSFDFDGPALAALKGEATRTLPADFAGGGGFVSTDDALTALTWSAVTRARLPRLRAGGVRTSPFARAVDARPHLPVPAAYLGLLNNMTYHDLPVDLLAGASPASSHGDDEAPLGVIAADLRRAVAPATTTIGLRTRALATFMARSPAHLSAVSLTARLDTTAGLMLSSWAAVDAHALRFGMGLGPAAAARRPRFAPVESLAYLLPRTPRGSVGLAVCLREEDLEALRGDARWTRFARYVG